MLAAALCTVVCIRKLPPSNLNFADAKSVDEVSYLCMKTEIFSVAYSQSQSVQSVSTLASREGIKTNLLSKANGKLFAISVP